MLDGCKNFMAKMLNVKLSHVFRECNRTVDALAKSSITELGFIIFDSPPGHAANAFLDDLYKG